LDSTEGSAGVRTAASSWHRKLTSGLIIAALLFYPVSYFVLSRIGISRAEKDNLPGYYFVDPTTYVGERIQIGCCVVYFPLIRLEKELGTGRQPASLPLMGLSK
jgi:hypothetical protein